MSMGNQQRTVLPDKILFDYTGVDSNFQVISRTNGSYAIREVTSEGVEVFFVYVGNNLAVTKRLVRWLERVRSN